MKTASFYTLGCRVNQYESQALAEQLVKAGYEIVSFGEKCDLSIINTCAVTAESGRKSAQIIRRAASFANEIRVCGCYSEFLGHETASFDKVTAFTGCKNKSLLTDIPCPSTEKGFELLNIATVPKSKVSAISRTRAFVKIQDGCNGRCTYCIIPSLRGSVRSRPDTDIIEEIKRLSSQGYREIILTGIETAAYNYMPLHELIKRVAAIDGVERIRLGSLDPNALNDSFIEAAKNTPKLMPHFHLSLQSGCNRILKLMQRPYTADGAKEKIEKLKTAISNVMLSADIICSFPTESEAELNETLEFLKNIGFMHIHAFSYSKRPNTKAATLCGQIPEDEKRKRISYFISECDMMKNSILRSKIGKIDSILIEKTSDFAALGHCEDFCEAKIKLCRSHKESDIVKFIVTDVENGILIGDEI